MPSVVFFYTCFRSGNYEFQLNLLWGFAPNVNRTFILIRFAIVCYYFNKTQPISICNNTVIRRVTLI
jgi:hypothetical protein